MPSPTALTLVIANKNYSSWSARAWLTMTALEIPFTERMVKFDSTDWDRNIATLSRALVANFHSGYQEFRSAMPMNIRSRYPGKGMSPKVAAEVDRVCAHWRDAKARFGGGGAFLFGEFCAADAFFTPVASRFLTYRVPLGAAERRYQEALLGTPAMQAWTAAALLETEFVQMDEPYATG